MYGFPDELKAVNNPFVKFISCKGKERVLIVNLLTNIYVKPAKNNTANAVYSVIILSLC